MLLVGLVLALASLGEAPAKKGYYALADMVDDAEFICVGRVTQIVTVSCPVPLHSTSFGTERSELPLALIAVERVLEGDPSVRSVFHEAWPTWTCDSTGAKIGERALFLLGRGGVVATAHEANRSAVQAAIGESPLFRNLGSGDGIQTIVEEDGEELVYSSGAPYALESEGRRTTLADVLRYIEEVERFRLDATSVHARSGFAGFVDTHGYDLRILPSGACRLATRLGPRERVDLFELEPVAWTDLTNELAMMLEDRERRVGPSDQRFPVRQLTVRIGQGQLDFVEPHAWWAVAELPTDERRAFRDSLTAWRLVREAIDCPECPTYAEEDRARLESLR